MPAIATTGRLCQYGAEQPMHFFICGCMYNMIVCTADLRHDGHYCGGGRLASGQLRAPRRVPGHRKGRDRRRRSGPDVQGAPSGAPCLRLVQRSYQSTSKPVHSNAL